MSNSTRDGAPQSALNSDEQLRSEGVVISNDTTAHDENNINVASSLEATPSDTQASTVNSALDDNPIRTKRSQLKERGSNVDPRVGAHQVNETAPNINRRFYAGQTSREARTRSREERRVRREGNDAGNHQQGNNVRSNTNGVVNHQASRPNISRNTQSRRNLFSRMASHSSIPEEISDSDDDSDNNNTPQLIPRTLSRRNVFTRTQSQSTLIRGDNDGNNDSFNPHGRTLSRRNIFTRMSSQANLRQDNGNNNNNVSRTMSRRNIFTRMTSQANILRNDNNRASTELTTSITATLVDDENIVFAEPFLMDDTHVELPDSEVGRIISRLEYRNKHRVAVNSDVKAKFLRLCDEACVKRVEIMRESMMMDGEDNASVDSDSSSSDSGTSNNSSSPEVSLQSPTSSTARKSITTTTASPCILREDVIQLRNTVRLNYESRTKMQRFQKLARSLVGFRDVDKVLLNVLNRAVDSIDESGHVEAKRRRKLSRRASTLGMNGSLKLLDQSGVMPMTTLTSTQSNGSVSSGPRGMMLRTNSIRLSDGGASDDDDRSAASLLKDDDDDENNDKKANIKKMRDEDKLEWFYYKDFAFYNMKVESKYPWVRNAGFFSLLVTLMFLFFTPILWCVLLNDENICPSHNGSYDGWLTSLFFASATMSTVGYGDVTVLVSYEDDLVTPYPQKWRIFIATIYMILSLIVSVVGFQAGLDSQFSPFRKRVDLTFTRVYEILRDANMVKGSYDKHEDIKSRMRFAKFSQLAEISLTFLILNLVGVFAIQLSQIGEDTDGYENLSWMESFYWACQTTTTIGYGDVEIPPGLRWFMIFYLAISTYFVGSAFGKLRDLNQNLESMQQLYLWEQQEATYTMLADFSGRPEDENDEQDGTDELLDVEPEIDQYEFVIASLVLLGKITSDDVRPILKKFNKLSGTSNKITAADVSGPMQNKNETEELANKSDASSAEANSDESKLQRQMSTGGTGALSVTKKIAKAVREELFSHQAADEENEILKQEEEKNLNTVDYSRFRIPPNTYAIAIDDSKIQRKLLSKFCEFAGISGEKTTIVGDGHDEIMGFEDFVVNFMENHPDDFVFLLVDENLDVVDDNSVRSTISGSLCVEKIRKRLPAKVERRMFALVRSANDSSSDIAIYSTRAHGFLPKAPIGRDKVLETLAPLWIGRFPPSEFGETIGFASKDDILTAAVAVDDIACTPYDIAQQIQFIETLFRDGKHISEIRLIHEQMHGLKGDLLTLNSTVSVTTIIGHINLILVAQSPETTLERWKSVRDDMNDILNTLQKNFRFPPNMHAIAIDDSKIQRKLLSKFFDFMGLKPEQCTILGDGADEIKGFEDFVVKFMGEHKSDYVFMVVDENLEVVDEASGVDESISGSVCVENIRKRLPYELERRLFALVRSANDSTSDIAIYNHRAHGFLPKAPIRREKVAETLAPLWLKRFPPAQFSDSIAYDNSDESATTTSEELACSAQDIAHKLEEMDARFNTDVQSENWRWMHDQLHELKGDILTMTSDASMISILGMINLLLGNKDSTLITKKWPKLRDRIYGVINEERTSSGSSQTTATGGTWAKVRESISSTKQRRRASILSNSNTTPTSKSTTTTSALSNSIKSTSALSNSIKSTVSDLSSP